MRIGELQVPRLLQLAGLAEGELGRAVAALASGLSLRAAADGAAELAAAQRLEALARGSWRAQRNVEEGLRLLATAEGGVAAIGEALRRMRELAVRAANGALSDQDRAAIEQEWAALLDVIRSLAADTAYNGMPLLDGSFTPRLETVTRTETVLVDPGEPPSVSVEPAPANAGFGGVSVSGTPLADATYDLRITRDAVFTPSETQVVPDPANRGPGRIEAAPSSNPTTQTSYEIRIKEQRVNGSGKVRVYEVREGGRGPVVLRGPISQGLELDLGNGAVVRFVDPPEDYRKDDEYWVYTVPAVEQPAEFEVTGPGGTSYGTVSDQPFDLGNGLALSFTHPGVHGAYRAGDQFTVVASAGRPPVYEERTLTETVEVGRYLQLGPGVGDRLLLDLPDVRPESLGVAHLSVATLEQAEASLEPLDRALNQVDAGRAAIGGLVSVLERLHHRLSGYAVNLEQARSRLVDADLAAEAFRLIGARVRLQATSAALSLYSRTYRTSLRGLLVSVSA